jgi:hypothetical protein
VKKQFGERDILQQRFAGAISSIWFFKGSAFFLGAEGRSEEHSIEGGWQLYSHTFPSETLNVVQ